MRRGRHERLLEASRREAKAARWVDERRTEFGRDQYVSDLVRGRLGQGSPVKRWLVRLLLKKLKTYEATRASLVDPASRRRSGAKALELP